MSAQEGIQAVLRVERRRVKSDALLAGSRELVIEHAGREYRLRLTANGKLILTA